MSRFNLLSDIENPNTKIKQKFQVFEVEMGFEKVIAYIPYEESDNFLNEASEIMPKSTIALSKIVNKYKGHIE